MGADQINDKVIQFATSILYTAAIQQQIVHYHAVTEYSEKID